MKKFALLIALCIVGVIGSTAQNVVRVINGDSVRVFVMESIDSLTINPDLHYFSSLGLKFHYPAETQTAGTVGLVKSAGDTVLVTNVCPFFYQNDFTYARGTNTLVGKIKKSENGYTITCAANQKVGYEDVIFVAYDEATNKFVHDKEIVFTLSADFKMLSTPGFATYTAQQGGNWSQYTNFVCYANPNAQAKKRELSKVVPFTNEKPQSPQSPVSKATQPLPLKAAEKEVDTVK